MLIQLKQIAIPEKKEILGNTRSISESDQFLLQSRQLLQERNPAYVRHMEKHPKYTSCQTKYHSLYVGKNSIKIMNVGNPSPKIYLLQYKMIHIGNKC